MSVRFSVCLAVGGAIALGLTGCVPEASSPPSPSASSVTPNDSSSGPENPGASPEAVLVSAALTVDGSEAIATGYVSGVLEDGGGCVFSFTPDSSGEPFSATSVGMADASTTVCPGVTVSAASFTSGSWQVTLEYTPPAGESLVSEPLTLEIP